MSRGYLVIVVTAILGFFATPVQAAATYDVRGGDVFYTNTSACTIGFSVVGGYVTTGQCGSPGTQTLGYNRVAQGTFQAVSVPKQGGAWVRVNSSWVPRPAVNRYNGTTAPVRGSRPAPVGSSACLSGATTHWHCGTITARNVSVSFPEGTLHGLIRTNICAEPRDIGGSLISGDQAQGILIGVSGNCSSGGVSYYLPINDILQRYGLRLVVA